MNKVKEIICICGYEFRIQMLSKRVWLGYLVGIVMALNQSVNYLRYTIAVGEPVNVFETFIIVANSGSTVMFLVLGWLLVISDAPFFNNNALYLLCRTSKKRWNASMVIYIILQGIFYYGVLAAVTVLVSAVNGYCKNIWSSPLVALTKNADLMSQYGIYFPYGGFIRTVSVYQGFWCSWILCLLYGLSLAVFLYVFNLVSCHIVGITATFLFHFLGYEIMQEGFGLVIKYSLLARSLAVHLIGAKLDADFSGTVGIFLLILSALLYVSSRLIDIIDYKEVSKGEGE